MELERIFNANTIQSVEVQEGNSVWRLNYKTEKNKWYCKMYISNLYLISYSI
jgi:hypothetical protein